MYMCIDEGDNHHPTIMGDILHIRFPYLSELNLANNDIASLEGIHSLMMPNLEELYLRRYSPTKTTTKSEVLEL